MKTRLATLLGFFLVLSLAVQAQWTPLVEGVDYRRYDDEKRDIHVTRVDLNSDAIRVIGSTVADRGLRVSDFAKKRNALVAINGDYFDAKFKPIGLAIGPCGRWEDTKDTTREGIAAFGDGRARIDPQRKVMHPPEEWIEAAVSGWPLLVKNCDALGAKELPGSDAFTRAPHPRTAVGLSEDRRYLYLVVADGRRPGVPGLTLAALGEFMAEELGACSAINLDGGGSSAMWVRDRVVNTPSDGVERRVADHLAIVASDDYEGCDKKPGIDIAVRPSGKRK